MSDPWKRMIVGVAGLILAAFAVLVARPATRLPTPSRLAPRAHSTGAMPLPVAGTDPSPRRLEAQRRQVASAVETAIGLCGHVRAVDGGPVKGAVVTAVVAAKTRSTTTDHQGEFRLFLADKASVSLTIEHPDYHGFGRIVESHCVDPLAVELKQLAALHGRVVDRAGRPLKVTQATLLVSPNGASGPWRVLGAPLAVPPAVGSKGIFDVPVRTQRHVRVVVEGPHFVRVISEALRVRGQRNIGVLLPTSPAVITAVGRIVDSTEEPISGAAIVVREDAGAYAIAQTGQPFRFAPVTAGPDGAFTTAPLAPGRYRLEASAPGRVTITSATFDVHAGVTLHPMKLELKLGRPLRERALLVRKVQLGSLADTPR